MPAAKRTELPAAYTQIMEDEARKALNEKRDCTVVALTVVTGLPYHTCHAALKEAGRKDRRGAYASDYITALKALGFAVRRWTSAEMVAMSRSYWDVYGKNVAGLTSHHPRRFPKCWEGKGPLLFRSRGHLAGVDANGVVHDWSINRSLRLIDVYSVEKIG